MRESISFARAQVLVVRNLQSFRSAIPDPSGDLGGAGSGRLPSFIDFINGPKRV